MRKSLVALFEEYTNKEQLKLTLHLFNIIVMQLCSVVATVFHHAEQYNIQLLN